MTVNINASLTQGLVLTSDTSGVVAFQSNNAETMRIDSSGNVGIGTTSPVGTAGTKLDVRGSITAGQATVGRVSLEQGTSTNSGYVAFWDSTLTTRQGYMGYATLAGSGAMNIFSENATNVLIFGTNSTERMRIDTSGILMLGTTSTNPVTSRVNGFIVTPGFGINLRGASQTCAFGLSSSSGTNIGFYTDNGSTYVTAGSISSNGSTTAFNTSSDYRLKENVLDLLGGVETVQKLRPVSYTWKEGYGNGAGEGFIAHELAEHIPLAVTGEKDAVDEEGNIKPQGVDYSKIVVHLVAAIKEQQSIISDLQSRIAALEAK